MKINHSSVISFHYFIECIAEFYLGFTTAMQKQAHENKERTRNKWHFCIVADYTKKFSHPELVDLMYSDTRSTIETHLVTNTSIVDFNNSLQSLINILFHPIVHRLKNVITEKQCT